MSDITLSMMDNYSEVRDELSSLDENSKEWWKVYANKMISRLLLIFLITWVCIF